MCFGLGLSRSTSDRFGEKQNLGEFARKEGALKVRWKANELDTTLKTAKNHRLTQ